MNEPDLDRVINTLWNLIVEKEAMQSPPKELLEIEGFKDLYNAIFEIRTAIDSVCAGELSYKVIGKGYLPSAVKSLQASMKHLIWYAKEVSLGDFSQKIDFMGEFSEAFNQMAEKLESSFNEITNLEIEAIEAKEHFEKIFNMSPETTSITRLSDGLIVDVNQAFLKVFDYKRDEVIGRCIQDLKIYQSYSERQRFFEEIKTNGCCRNLKVILRKKSGEKIIALMSATEIKLRDISHLIVVARDITLECQLQEALYISEEKYRILFENALEMITVFQKGKLRICNQISEKLTGYSMEELLSSSALEFIHPDDRKRMIDEHSRILNGEIFENSSIFRLKRKDTSVRWIEMKSIKIEWENEDATLNLLFDITERKLALEEIKFLSYHDQLTGLYNRRFYEKEIKILNDDEKSYPISIIMADLNGLKLTNDAFGHAAGDTLLTSIAAILKRECRKNDIVARIGGDEFAILLPNTEGKSAENIINRINNAIENEKIDNAVLSLSMGLAVKADAFDDIDEIFKIAEDDMYKHKLSKSENMKRRTVELVIDKLYESNAELHHSQNVGRISQAIASELKLSQEEIKKIKMAGLMHDIGKIGVGEELFNKLGKLSTEERAATKRHSEIGYRILNSVDEFADVSRFILEHHERWNGSGYPKGLKENEISLPARIIAVADSFDKMTSGSSNKKTLTIQEAEEEIKKNSGVKFDPSIVKIFIDNVLEKIQNNSSW